MRSKGISLVARLVFCGLLLVLGLNGASAASAEGKGLANAGSIFGSRPTIEPGSAYCESACCWASCEGYDDCQVSCSSSGCSASGGKESASVSCLPQ